MLEPIDFLHDPRQDSYLLEPKVIHDQIIAILDDAEEWIPEVHTRFALLNRMIWAISVLDAIDNYRDFTNNDIATFFLAFNVFNEIIEAFESINANSATIFSKTLQEKIFSDGIVKNRDDYSFTRFIRSLSVAHTTNTDRGGQFLKSGCIFILSSIDSQSATPTDEEIENAPKSFYFHVLVLKDGKSTPEIFKLYIDELKAYLTSSFNNCNFEKLNAS